MEETKKKEVKEVSLSIHRIDTLALQCVHCVIALHAMERTIIEGDEDAEGAKEAMEKTIKKTVDKFSELCAIATIIGKGRFETVEVDDDSDKDEAKG